MSRMVSFAKHMGDNAKRSAEMRTEKYAKSDYKSFSHLHVVMRAHTNQQISFMEALGSLVIFIMFHYFFKSAKIKHKHKKICI